MSTRSIKTTLSSAIVIGSLVLMTVSSTPAPAQVCGPDVDGRVANAVYRDTIIVWEPVVEYEQMILTIAGPCEDIVRVFRRGEPIFFDIREIGRVQDGAYTWELRRAPILDPSTQEALARARVLDDDSIWWNLWQSGAIPQGPYVDSTSFLVANGVIVPPGLEEGKSGLLAKTAEIAARPVTSPAAAEASPERGFSSLSTASKGRGPKPTTAADQVIPDDLIVQGSLCVGFDCVNNESFSFDTIRLKENNLRIKFDDTSTISGFPQNDWQLTANDSASGGASKFSIEDITGAKVPFTVRAGAANNSIFVDSTGRVGFRTSTPILDLHVNTSNTPAVRLEQNSSGGFAAQTWDIAGNEANFFVRDVTGGSKLPLRIRPGAPTSSIDIAADGGVGIGTTSPDVRMDIKVDTSGVAVMRLQNQNGTGYSAIEFLEPSTTTETVEAFLGVHHPTNEFRINSVASNPFVILTNGTERIRFPAPGGNFITATNGAVLNSIGQWVDGSSRDLKQEITDLSIAKAMETLTGLNPVTYAYKLAPDEVQAGFIAEDVPELVAQQDRKGLNSLEIVAVLTKVVQEQQKTIEELSARLADLEKEKK